MSNAVPRKTDVLILGAGAAGLMCAREASAHGLDVALLERAPSPGRKLCISGGGKANFTNRRLAAHHYACADPAFCEPALDAFTPQDMERLVHGWGLPVEERAHGQLFLTVPAKRLLDALVQDCRRQGCALHCQTDVHDVVPLPDGAGFEVGTSQGLWRCRRLVLALGSPAWPQCGATGSGFRLAQALGHRLVEHAPALTPFRMAPGWLDDNLAGISLPVRIGLPQAGLSPSLAADPVWQDDLLFTHDGISGPASLKASLFWRPGQEVALDFLPGSDLAALLDGPGQGKQTPRGLLRRLLPQRLVDALLPPETAGRKIAELSRAARQQICACIHDFRTVPAGLAGLKKAEACRGGVDTRQVDPYSLQSTVRENLWIVGELLDVTGLLGGYNLHWAWASGMAAGRALALFAGK
nr:aminoacetone oxidase family FAD-binding enzyme [Desulfovibrio piger]